MFDTNKNVEILAPAGGFESVYAAVRCGTDAVYLGVKNFSARANAANFDAPKLKEAVRYCHLHGVFVYIAVNTLIFDGETAVFLKTAEIASQTGVDALIVQDLGAARLLRKAIPDMKLHASTQMSIHTSEGVLLAKELGFRRVVLARELNRPQIAEICEKAAESGVEIEVFVHGALCMCVSGQCAMSAVIGGRSANRGRCAQPCRLPYTVNSEQLTVNNPRSHPLSLKDLCLIEHIGELREMGVASLKIEGRMKRPEYVAAAVSAYRAALDGGVPDLYALRSVFSRSGFTDGYYTGEIGAQMFGVRQKEDVTAAESVLPKLRELYRKEKKSHTANFCFYAKKGEQTKLTMTVGGPETTVFGDVAQTAERRPVTAVDIETRLSKLGDTAYKIGQITAEIDDGLSLSAASINALRRTAVERMNEMLADINAPKYRINPVQMQTNGKNERGGNKIRIQIYSAAQLDEKIINHPDIEKIIIPVSQSESIKSAPNIILSLPRFISDETALEKCLERFKSCGFAGVLCDNISHIRLGKKAGFTLHGGFGLNVTNAYSLAVLRELGLADAVVSFECTLKQIADMESEIPVGAVAYGRLPLMLAKNRSERLTDRTGRTLQARRNYDYSEILNADLLVMSDRLKEINADFILLDFCEESPEKILAVIKQYKSGGEARGTYTRGLYYRGVK